MSSGLVSLYSEVHAVPVQWLWYPYIPIGKITLLQGDPGDGKSTMMMDLIAQLTIGGTAPDGAQFGEPKRAIYQCSQDNAADTIKPRLLKRGADCSKVAFLNQEQYGTITLNDERLRDAIQAFKPALLVVDPIQSYLGNDADLQVAGKARKAMQRLSLWASLYDCAVVLIGHLNKSEGQKNLYRGLGSIDIAATARSVLQVKRDDENQQLRHVSQIKNNLGPFGSELLFQISANNGFHWRVKNASSDLIPLLPNVPAAFNSQLEKASYIIKQNLQYQDMSAEDIRQRLQAEGISRRTIDNAKKALGIRSYRVMRKWYWSLKPPIKQTLKSEEANTISIHI